jgi:hypothetical protein
MNDTVPMSMSKPSDPSAGFKNKNNLECSRRNVSEIKLQKMLEIERNQNVISHT